MDEDLALQQYAISKLSHRRTVAATTVLYKMHTPSCPVDLKALLPQAHIPGRITRRVLPSHALTILKSNTKCLDRSFLHSAITTWNSLPPAVVGDITPSGIVEKSHLVSSPPPIPLDWIHPSPYSYGVDSPLSPALTHSQSPISPVLTHSSLVACYILCLSLQFWLVSSSRSIST